MQILEIKITLYRSNPSVIRQFTVPCGMTVAGLQEVLSILVGWRGSKAWKAWNREKVFQGKETVADVMQEGTPLYLCPDKNAVGRNGDLQGINTALVFRGVLLGKAEQEEYPRIIRWRGPNIPEDVEDIHFFNELQAWWIHRTYTYRSMAYYRYDASGYAFSPQPVSAELRRRFAPAKKDSGDIQIPELDYDAAYPMISFLQDFKASELKEIAAREKIHIPAGAKKNQVLECVSQGLAQEEVLGRQLQYLTLGEYRIFQSFCTEEPVEADEELFQMVAERFRSNGWIRICFWGYSWGDSEDYDIDVSTELLEFYEEWLRAGKEKEFLRRAQIYTSIQGSVRLYAFLRKERWLKLAAVWLGGSFSKQELENGWQDYFSYIQGHPNRMTGCRFPDLFYDRLCLDEETLDFVLNNYSSTPYLQPSFKALQEIELQGLYFGEPERKRLETFLKRECGIYEDNVEAAGRTIYYALRSNRSAQETLSALLNYQRIHNRSVQKNLMQMIESLKPYVRQISLGGYTAREYAELKKK